MRKLNGTNYVVQKSPRSQPVIIHADRLKPYFGSLQDTGWAMEAVEFQSGSEAIVHHDFDYDERSFKKMDAGLILQVA